MDWNNAFTLVGVFIGTAIAAFIGYSRRWPPPKQDPILTGIGIGFGDREMQERLISELKGCRVALEVLADRRTEEMEDIHRELLARLDRKEEQEESRPRRQPTRRR